MPSTEFICSADCERKCLRHKRNFPKRRKNQSYADFSTELGTGNCPYEIKGNGKE